MDQRVNHLMPWAESCELNGRQNEQEDAETVLHLARRELFPRLVAEPPPASRTRRHNEQDCAHGIPKLTLLLGREPQGDEMGNGGEAR
jgi:hypothetical protein